MKTKNKNDLGILMLFGMLVIWILMMDGCVQQQQKEITELKTTIQQQPSENFLTYESSVDGIRIKYPKDWLKQEKVMGTIVVFLSPKESSLDVFQENLNIMVQDISTHPMTLEEYTDLSIKQIKAIVTDYNLIDSSATILANSPAHKIVYTGKQGRYNLKWMQVYTIKKNKVYLLTYTAEVDKYPNFLEVIEEMINSFEIVS